MEILKRIEVIIEEPLAARGYTVVRIQLSGGIRKVLQIMIERLDEVAITVDDCAIVSRLVSVLMDVSDPIKDPYSLEVSSAGLERPLVKLGDYQRFIGHDVLVTTYQTVDGRKRFQGRLFSVDEDKITLELGNVSTGVAQENSVESTQGESRQAIIELSNIRAARLFVDYEKL